MFINHNASQDDIVKNKNADIKFIVHQNGKAKVLTDQYLRQEELMDC
jgi:hypothetical protein